MQKSFWVRVVVAVFSLCALAAGAHAGDLKVGAVFPAVIFKESKIAQAMSQKIQDDFSPRDKELAAQVADFKKKVADFERDAPTMGEDQRNRKKKEIADIDRDLQKKQRDFQLDLETRRRTDQQHILELINKAVIQVAKTEHFDFILQDVVYAAPGANLTQKVMDEMNKQAGN